MEEIKLIVKSLPYTFCEIGINMPCLVKRIADTGNETQPTSWIFRGIFILT